MVEKPPKINDIALRLSAEYMRLFTIELVHRSTQVARQEEKEEENERLHDSPSSPAGDHNLRAGLKGLIQVCPPRRLALSLHHFAFTHTFLKY